MITALKFLQLNSQLETDLNQHRLLECKRYFHLPASIDSSSGWIKPRDVKGSIYNFHRQLLLSSA